MNLSFDCQFLQRIGAVHTNIEESTPVHVTRFAVYKQRSACLRGFFLVMEGFWPQSLGCYSSFAHLRSGGDWDDASSLVVVVRPLTTPATVRSYMHAWF